ncbi:MAG: preprotein translocase subunit SecY [Patescibacteria group bacterium]|nr:preprotein translocase subunit SecY [Patescibacteria group bacterium]
MWEKIRQIWKISDLRNSIIFVLAMLVAYRVAAHIPIPGVDVTALRDFFQSNQILGLINVFSGGAMDSFSVIGLGVGPYITASIIFQLLAMIVPKLEEMQKEGEQGQARINQYTRMLTVPLAALQGHAMIQILRQSQRQIIGDLTILQYAAILITMTCGTMFLMWIGELITERKIGNGVSILIFASIVSRVPTMIQQALVSYDASQIINWVAFAVIGVVTVAGVVFITEGQRNLPVTYARRLRGARLFGGMETHLPLRVNMAGVIPIIFAISIILLPPMVSQFFMQAKTAWIAASAQWVITTFNNQWVYGVSYFLLVFIFTYFYTAVVFHPDRVAENLQKQGGFIPGIRPGHPTSEYINRVVNRIIPAGAFFLAIIAVLPLAVQQITGTQNIVVGGTSLLIVVSVAIEIVNQVNAQMQMREYEAL